MSFGENDFAGLGFLRQDFPGGSAFFGDFFPPVRGVICGEGLGGKGAKREECEGKESKGSVFHGVIIGEGLIIENGRFQVGGVLNG